MTSSQLTSAENARLQAHREQKANWKNWGPYLSERAWGTVREDYSETGDAWHYFPHDHARSAPIAGMKMGLQGFLTANRYLCFALALWNGKILSLKERMFGFRVLKEIMEKMSRSTIFILTTRPRHSYMKMLYKYPQNRFPYEQLVEENQQTGLSTNLNMNC